MAENLNKRPPKGILKSPSSFETNETRSNSNTANLKFDEANILETLHPPEKDYGHMKIEEPKTPYTYYDENTDKEISEGGHDELDANELADRMSKYNEETDKPTVLKSNEEEEEEDDEDLTEEEKAAKSAFEYKRKMHYNEFYAVKLARKLIDKDSDEELEETEENDEENKEDNIEDQ